MSKKWHSHHPNDPVPVFTRHAVSEVNKTVKKQPFSLSNMVLNMLSTYFTQIYSYLTSFDTIIYIRNGLGKRGFVHFSDVLLQASRRIVIDHKYPFYLTTELIPRQNDSWRIAIYK